MLPIAALDMRHAAIRCIATAFYCTISNETMIPLLPCGSINEILKFYPDLGFTITYQQKAPNVFENLVQDDRDRLILQPEIIQMADLTGKTD